MDGPTILASITVFVALLGVAAVVAIVARPLRLPYSVALVARRARRRDRADARPTGQRADRRPRDRPRRPPAGARLRGRLPARPRPPAPFAGGPRLPGHARRAHLGLGRRGRPPPGHGAPLRPRVHRRGDGLGDRPGGRRGDVPPPAGPARRWRPSSRARACSTTGPAWSSSALAVGALAAPISAGDALVRFVATVAISGAIGHRGRLRGGPADVARRRPPHRADDLGRAGLWDVPRWPMPSTSPGSSPRSWPRSSSATTAGDRAMSPGGIDALDTVWEFLAYLLTALVFLLVGLAFPFAAAGRFARLDRRGGRSGPLVGRALVVYVVLGGAARSCPSLARAGGPDRLAPRPLLGRSPRGGRGRHGARAAGHRPAARRCSRRSPSGSSCSRSSSRARPPPGRPPGRRRRIDRERSPGRRGACAAPTGAQRPRRAARPARAGGRPARPGRGGRPARADRPPRRPSARRRPPRGARAGRRSPPARRRRPGSRPPRRRARAAHGHERQERQARDEQPRLRQGGGVGDPAGQGQGERARQMGVGDRLDVGSGGVDGPVDPEVRGRAQVGPVGVGRGRVRIGRHEEQVVGDQLVLAPARRRDEEPVAEPDRQVPLAGDDQAAGAEPTSAGDDRLTRRRRDGGRPWPHHRTSATVPAGPGPTPSPCGPTGPLAGMARYPCRTRPSGGIVMSDRRDRRRVAPPVARRRARRDRPDRPGGDLPARQPRLRARRLERPLADPDHRGRGDRPVRRDPARTAGGDVGHGAARGIGPARARPQRRRRALPARGWRERRQPRRGGLDQRRHRDPDRARRRSRPRPAPPGRGLVAGRVARRVRLDGPGGLRRADAR